LPAPGAPACSCTTLSRTRRCRVIFKKVPEGGLAVRGETMQRPLDGTGQFTEKRLEWRRELNPLARRKGGKLAHAEIRPVFHVPPLGTAVRLPAVTLRCPNGRSAKPYIYTSSRLSWAAACRVLSEEHGRHPDPGPVGTLIRPWICPEAQLAAGSGESQGPGASHGLDAGRNPASLQ
jgi:hypothetical protein